MVNKYLYLCFRSCEPVQEITDQWRNVVIRLSPGWDCLIFLRLFPISVSKQKIPRPSKQDDKSSATETSLQNILPALHWPCAVLRNLIDRRRYNSPQLSIRVNTELYNIFHDSIMYTFLGPHTVLNSKSSFL